MSRVPRRSPRPETKRRDWWDVPAVQLAIVAVGLLLVYAPALRGLFLFDDQAFIAGNRLVTAPDGIGRIWFSPRESPHYWPVSFTVLWAEWQAWGTHTLGYHVVNVLLHAANVILLARLLVVLGVPGALWIALVFAVHPMNVEAVAWMPRAASGALTAAVAALVVLGVLSWRQAALYDSPTTIWSDTVRRNPSAWVAHFNLGVEYQSRGEVRSAVDHYLQATALKSDYARAEYNLGVGLRDLGRTEEAIARFRRAIAIRPAYPRALKELGATLRMVGRRDEAIAPFTEAVRLQPVYSDAHAQLGFVLLELGQWLEAQAELQKALEQDSALATAWTTGAPPWMGRDERDADRWRVVSAALAESGRFPEAVAAVTQAQSLASARGDRTLLDRLDRMAMSIRHRRPFREPTTP